MYKKKESAKEGKIIKRKKTQRLQYFPLNLISLLFKKFYQSKFLT